MRKFAVDTPILTHDKIGTDVWRMKVEATVIADAALPGQFVHIQLPQGDTLLRRPISIADAEHGTLTLIYRTVGKGTRLMASLPEYQTVNCLGPLGMGFDLNCERPLLVGGGMGIAPLLFLAKRLGGRADILMGGRTKSELHWTDVFDEYVKRSFITTDDGSMGEKGFTVTLLPKLLAAGAYDRVFTCGPEIMMRGVAQIAAEHGVACQVSLEKHMACGVGACLSCTCEDKDGKRRKVCADGPVFWAQEVL